MSLVDTVMYAVHLLFGGLWTGTVVFVTVGILPVATRGDVGLDLLEHVTQRLTRFTRLSSLLMLVTGGHLAGNLYTAESLLGTPRGYLVVAMVVLWLALTALVEVAGARLRSGIDEMKIRTPATEARPFLLAASAVSLLLLVVAGLLAGNAV